MRGRGRRQVDWIRVEMYKCWVGMPDGGEYCIISRKQYLYLFIYCIHLSIQSNQPNHKQDNLLSINSTHHQPNQTTPNPHNTNPPHDQYQELNFSKMCHYEVHYFSCTHYTSGTPVKCAAHTGGAIESCPNYEGERKTDVVGRECASCVQKKVVGGK